MARRLARSVAAPAGAALGLVCAAAAPVSGQAWVCRPRVSASSASSSRPSTTRGIAWRTGRFSTATTASAGRTGEALQLARRTRELDPTSPYLAILEADYLLHDSQFEAAVSLYEYAIQIEPDNPNAYFGLAETRYRQGRFDEALEARRAAHLVAGDERLEPLFADARGDAGYREIDAAWVRLQIEELEERARTAYVSPLDVARAFAQLGETDVAFRYLEASFEDRAPGLVFLNVDPAWDRVRDDPKFAEAVARVGLP